MNYKNEGDVKKHVKNVLREYEPQCWWFMPPANGFGRSGIPDFVGVAYGQGFAIETKFGKNDLSTHQLRETQKAVQAGTKMWIVRETSVVAWEAEFRGWMALCS